MNIDVSPMRDLAIARGRTALEIFLALSPRDAEVPAALQETHEAQARSGERTRPTSSTSTSSCLPWSKSMGVICRVAPTKYAVQATLLPGHLFRLRTAHVTPNLE